MKLPGVRATNDWASPFFYFLKKTKTNEEFIWVIDKMKFYVKFIREVNRGWMLAQCHYFTHYTEVKGTDNWGKGICQKDTIIDKPTLLTETSKQLSCNSIDLPLLPWHTTAHQIICKCPPHKENKQQIIIIMAPILNYGHLWLLVKLCALPLEWQPNLK